MSAWQSRTDILAGLGIKPQTLYAYVSRGLIAARPDPSDPRRSLYSVDDAQALAEKRSRGRRARDVAQGAIAWGEAILPTAISTIAHGRLFYRQRDAVRFAVDANLEDAAALLWNAPVGTVRAASAVPSIGMGGPVTATMMMLAAQAAVGMPTRGRTASTLAAESAVLLKSVAQALGAGGDADIASGFARAWLCDAQTADLLRIALVLLADHELNASTFAARIAASTGASLAAALLAGFATLTGPAHGGAALRLANLCRDAGRTDPATAISGWIARGEPLPGFGHPLYPDGDPRAASLLLRLELSPKLAGLAAGAERVAGLKPNIDFALVALVEILGLPEDAPLRLFAAGRTCGWLAHAMEQAATGTLIRPRAYYSGPPLESE